jgi:hypothetical protein
LPAWETDNGCQWRVSQDSEQNAHVRCSPASLMSTDAIGKLCSTPLRKETKKLQTPISFVLCKRISRVSSQREIESLTHQRLYIQFFDVDEVICQVGNNIGGYEFFGLTPNQWEIARWNLSGKLVKPCVKYCSYEFMKNNSCAKMLWTKSKYLQRLIWVGLNIFDVKGETSFMVCAKTLWWRIVRPESVPAHSEKQVHRFVVDVKQTVCKDRQVWTPQSSVYRFNLHPNVSDICLTVRKTNPLQNGWFDIANREESKTTFHNGWVRRWDREDYGDIALE